MLKSENYDLVITDVVMPHVSGLAIISLIKEESSDFPVIAITAYGKNPERLAAEKRVLPVSSEQKINSHFSWRQSVIPLRKSIMTFKLKL